MRVRQIKSALQEKTSQVVGYSTCLVSKWQQSPAWHVVCRVAIKR